MHELSRKANHKFKYVPSRRSIVCSKTDKALTGLHPILNSCFWPKYNKEEANSQCTRPRNGALMKSYLFKDLSKAKSKRKPGQPRPVERGRYFGIKIDKQIETSVAISTKFKLPCKVFYDKQVRMQHAGRLPVNVLKAIHLFHIFTKRFWKAIDGLQWTPVATQVGVGCKKWNVATRIDVLAVDKEGIEHVIEVKVGYDGYYYKCTEHKLNFPFQEKEDCLYHQHMIQVAMTNELYKRTYRKSQRKSKKVGNPIVLRLTSTNTYIYFVADWVEAAMNDLKPIKAPLASLV
jgi:hypothetical protein